jgi:hypothetical protein
MLKSKILNVIPLIFICLSICFYAQVAFSGEREVKLTTADITEPYEILGIISHRSGLIEIDSINNQLKKQAKDLGADYVIGIGYINYAGYLFGYGTAVKVIKE